MPLYDYACKSCGHVFEVEKGMAAPGPGSCPKCGAAKPERYFVDQKVSITYANRPPWTYKECLKYKDCKHNDGPRTKIDPSKHGDLGAWNSPGEVIKPATGKKRRRS